jgi:hypothetical protein
MYEWPYANPFTLAESEHYTIPPPVQSNELGFSKIILFDWPGDYISGDFRGI